MKEVLGSNGEKEMQTPEHVPAGPVRLHEHSADCVPGQVYVRLKRAAQAVLDGTRTGLDNRAIVALYEAVKDGP